MGTREKRGGRGVSVGEAGPPNMLLGGTLFAIKKSKEVEANMKEARTGIEGCWKWKF